MQARRCSLRLQSRKTQRCGAHLKGREQDAHPAGFCRLAALPLPLLAQPTGATIANAGRVEQPQTAISFASLRGRVERLARWTTQGAVWLEGKGISSKATGFPRRVAVVGLP